MDLIIDSPDGAVIIDYKTSYQPSKSWPIQGSAYAYLARKAGYNVTGIRFLHLNKLGLKPDIYDYPDQFDIFSKCLDVYNYFYKPTPKKKSGTKS
jgi:hypothetical protein